MITDIMKELLIIFLFGYLSGEQERENIKQVFKFYIYCMVKIVESGRAIMLHLLNIDDDVWVEEGFNAKIEDNKETIKPEIKYEDKYLVEIRKMDKEYVFTDEEKERINKKTVEIYNAIIIDYKNTIQEKENKIKKLEEKLARYEGSSDDEYCDIDEDGDDDSLLGHTKEEKINNISTERNTIANECESIKTTLETSEGQNEMMENAKSQAITFIINERLDILINNFVIEKTPNGNVLMFWNNKRGTFEYYSDNTIPYRYLESVGRKYVKTFNCRPVFVDMEEELRLSEERLQKEKEEKERKEFEEKQRLEEAKMNNTPIVPDKKNVFAKFKSYNKEAGSGRVNMVAPPKNSIPNKSVTEPNSKEQVLLKDRANRYTYEGKFSNFKFLKKIERKVVDKKYAMSFADFKKNILTKK
jgi:hypothetical protein